MIYFLLRIFFFISLISLISLRAGNLQAELPFYQDHARGWFWYEDPEANDEALEKKLEDPSRLPPIISEKKPKTAVDRLKEVQAHLAELKATALLEPTSKNVKAYQDMQMKVMNQSEAFSRAWVMNVFMNPSLDENVKNPSAQSARFVVYEKERQKTESIIQELKNSYGLFYFYSGSCAYCKAFNSLVKLFADKYGWEVMAISLDGAPSDVFLNWQPDNGIAQQWNVQTVPTVFAINPETDHVIPVANGFTAIDEMEKRIVTIVQQEEKRQGDKRQ